MLPGIFSIPLFFISSLTKLGKLSIEVKNCCGIVFNSVVYMDGRSLKIVPSDEENTNQIQKSLRETLHTHLNNAGRQSLAKRAFENTKFITYKTFKLLQYLTIDSYTNKEPIHAQPSC
jgi:hypothetical protein